MRQPLTSRFPRWIVSVALVAAGVAAGLALRTWVPGLRPEYGGRSGSPHVFAEILLALSCFILASTFLSMYRRCNGLVPHRELLLVLALFATVAGVARIVGLLKLSNHNLNVFAAQEMVSATLALVGAMLVAALAGRSRNFLATAQASQRNEARFIAASESSLQAFYMLRAVRSNAGQSNAGQIIDFEFIYLNRNGEKLIGLPRDEVLGRQLRTLATVNLVGGFFDDYKQVVMTGEPVVQEFPSQLEDDLPRWIRHEVVRLDDGIAITASDITERKMTERAAQHQAQHDALTGLANRSLLDDRVQQAIDRAVRYRDKVALFVVDMDRFKEINDTLGHAAGDLVLVTVAHRLRESVRATDSVLRIGGDEFIVVMPDVHEEKDVRRLAAKITTAIARGGPAGMPGVNMSCSIGIAIYPTQAGSAEELFLLADAAMYQAKHNGGGGFEVYSQATRTFEPQFVPAGKRVSAMRTAVVPTAHERASTLPEA